jgi:hypothetical protein
MKIRDIKQQLIKAKKERESILYVKYTHPSMDPGYSDLALANVEFRIVSLEDALRILKKKRLGRIIIGLIITSIITVIATL